MTALRVNVTAQGATVRDDTGGKMVEAALEWVDRGLTGFLYDIA
eukprot:gene8073-1188_t